MIEILVLANWNNQKILLPDMLNMLLDNLDMLNLKKKSNKNIIVWHVLVNAQLRDLLIWMTETKAHAKTTQIVVGKSRIVSHYFKALSFNAHRERELEVWGLC